MTTRRPADEASAQWLDALGETTGQIQDEDQPTKLGRRDPGGTLGKELG